MGQTWATSPKPAGSGLVVIVVVVAAVVAVVTAAAVVVVVMKAACTCSVLMRSGIADKGSHCHMKRQARKHVH